MTIHKSPPPVPKRYRLPDERESITADLSIEGKPICVSVGLYEDGSPGEIFARMGTSGSAIGSLLDAWCVMLSIGLQCGMPLEIAVDKFKNWRFEPAGITGNEEIPLCHSPIDLVCKWLELRFLNRKDE